MIMNQEEKQKRFLENRKLGGLNPGLIKISYHYNGRSTEELACIFHPDISRKILLPNNTLCYRPFLIDVMNLDCEGLASHIGPFPGYSVLDEHITEIKGRSVGLNLHFSDVEKNFHHTLIEADDPCKLEVISTLCNMLLSEGINIKNSNQQEYQSWEERKLKDF